MTEPDTPSAPAATSQTFRSRFSPLMRMCAALGAGGALFLVGAAAFGQYRAGRFPVYQDLLLAGLIAVAIAAAVAAMLYVAVLFFTVEVRAEGLRCYDFFCRYQTVPWEAMSAATPTVTYGLPYLYIEAPGLSQPVTLPLWLLDMPGFVDAVARQAGEAHLLVVALRAPGLPEGGG